MDGGATPAAAATAAGAHAELSGNMKELMSASATLSVSLELKILSALIVLFLFLLFLIMVLWDRYGKEISELYTSPTSGIGHGRDASGTFDVAMSSESLEVLSACASLLMESRAFPLRRLFAEAAEVKVHDVADEYTVYQKLPTFFYEYMPRRKKND
ncbi:hypothetical protein BBJ28_00021688 [Nothophytophthora sp. Chile5]|nr:hypothetical protein BBJ28_00021688 [Nothophytophthora sp. Chile5]